MTGEGRTGHPDRLPSGRRRGHRRAVAAPTNPDADQSDDLPAGMFPAPPPGTTAEESGAARAAEVIDPRDAWILEQRPPHWD